MVSFLAGYYYSYLKQRNNFSPIIIENLGTTPKIPEHLLKLAEIENITSLLISPILLKKQIKGTLILGSGDRNNFSNVDFDLLKLLTDSALRLDESTNSESTVHDPEEPQSFGSIIGKSSSMQEIYKIIIKIAPSDSNVFIYGESGTGKELIARMIHSQSRRKTQAFISVDCVALPESLIESELFGYERGAFTGANSIKRGLVEYSDKGTFFLDEIAEMNIELQAKLLRVLQERQFRRIGGKKLIDIDIRI
ncbi:MAG: sigma-54-dependent Fis family transcriptional regulator, partial [Thaumarchaeota archaeon]|nr:sigma-54-dependent Fis family transcriptional regulator [Nitrososphaerota archaeon]